MRVEAGFFCSYVAYRYYFVTHQRKNAYNLLTISVLL